jgi:tRNA C32,U32 (ribose-2'-O)-methylase TrmJ
VPPANRAGGDGAARQQDSKQQQATQQQQPTTQQQQQQEQQEQQREAGGGGAPPPPIIVLVEPKRGENIGATARAMKNFGLRKLRLVAPVDGWPNERARAVAARAADVIDAARVYGSLGEAVADVDVLYATTGRTRGRTLHARQLMCHELAADLPPAGQVRAGRGRAGARQAGRGRGPGAGAHAADAAPPATRRHRCACACARPLAAPPTGSPAQRGPCPRLPGHPHPTPAAAAPDRLQAAVLFGREDNGLHNHELALADVLVTIDSDPSFYSLNLGQAALLVCYNLYRGRARRRAVAPAPRRASKGEQELLMAELLGALEARGHWRDANREAGQVGQRRRLRRWRLRCAGAGLPALALQALAEAPGAAAGRPWRGPVRSWQRAAAEPPLPLPAGGAAQLRLARGRALAARPGRVAGGGALAAAAAGGAAAGAAAGRPGLTAGPRVDGGWGCKGGRLWQQAGVVGWWHHWQHVDTRP